MMNLCELTGQESGLVIYDDGSVSGSTWEDRLDKEMQLKKELF